VCATFDSLYCLTARPIKARQRLPVPFLAVPLLSDLHQTVFRMGVSVKTGVLFATAHHSTHVSYIMLVTDGVTPMTPDGLCAKEVEN